MKISILSNFYKPSNQNQSTISFEGRGTIEKKTINNREYITIKDSQEPLDGAVTGFCVDVQGGEVDRIDADLVDITEKAKVHDINAIILSISKNAKITGKAHVYDVNDSRTPERQNKYPINITFLTPAQIRDAFIPENAIKDE